MTRRPSTGFFEPVAKQFDERGRPLGNVTKNPQRRFLGTLPVFKTEFGSLMWMLGENIKAMRLTCPRCNKTFYMEGIAPETATASCPWCKSTSKHV